MHPLQLDTSILSLSPTYWPWWRYCSSLAQSFVLRHLFWVGVTVLHQHSGLFFCDSLSLQRKWMELSCLGLCLLQEWTENCLCCPLSPLWLIRHSATSLTSAAWVGDTALSCRIMQSGAAAETAPFMSHWAARLALLLPSPCAFVSFLLLWSSNNLDLSGTVSALNQEVIPFAQNKGHAGNFHRVTVLERVSLGKAKSWIWRFNT